MLDDTDDYVSFARVKTFGSLYYRNAQESYLAYLALERELAGEQERNANSEWHEDYFDQSRRHTMLGVQTIVFAAMCVEASAYDYVAVHLGEAYVKDHLDRLDVISKWVVALRLISNYNMPKDGALYASLKQLIKARNGLVHVKSERFDASQSQRDRLDRQSDQLRKDVAQAIPCVMLMSLTFQIAAKAAAQHLPMEFLQAGYSNTSVPEELLAPFAECRRIAAEQA